MCCKRGPEMETFDSDTFSATIYAAGRREPLALRQALLENGTAEKPVAILWVFAVPDSQPPSRTRNVCSQTVFPFGH
jgi:hypothetical protein